MKKIKLPRKRKKQYIKDHSAMDYMAVRILNELCLEDGKHNKEYNPKKFIKKYLDHPNGMLKKIISFY